MKKHDRKAILRRRALFVGSGLVMLGCGPGRPGPLGSVETPSHMPPLEPPAGTPAQVASELRLWLGTLRIAHSRVDEAMAALPRDCSITDPDCEGPWIELAQVHDAMTFAVDALPAAPPCRGTSADARAYDRRWLEHRSYLSKRLTDFNEALAGELSKATDGERAWKAMVDRLRRPTDIAALCRIDPDTCARVCLELHHEDCPDDW